MMISIKQHFSAAVHSCMRAGALALLTVALLVPMHVAKADSWSSFCRQEKNSSLCLRGHSLCESGTGANIPCSEIKSIIMRYRGFSIAHLKAAKRDEEREKNQRSNNR